MKGEDIISDLAFSFLMCSLLKVEIIVSNLFAVDLALVTNLKFCPYSYYVLGFRDWVVLKSPELLFPSENIMFTFRLRFLHRRSSKGKFVLIRFPFEYDNRVLCYTMAVFSHY